MNTKNDCLQRPPVPTSGTALSARQRRQLAKLAARVTRWWDAVPAVQRRPFYSLDAVAADADIAASRLGPVLRHMGWLRVQVRLDGIATCVWVPPGYPSPLRPIGRPRKNPSTPVHH